MEVVVNEWLLDYLRPDAQESNKKAAIQFLNVLMQKCDKIVIRRKSPFTDKFYDYSKQSEQNINSKQHFSKLHKLFRDADKTIIVDEDELKELPRDIADKTHRKDKYLIELWYSKQDRIVLTIDEKLKDGLKNIAGLKICLLEEFLQEYIA